MKAIRVHEFGGPEVLKFEEVPDPKPGADEYVVRIHAVGVNPVETYVRTGTYASKPTLPYTPGSDAAGVVESAGAAAKRFKPGDRVYLAGSVSGAYAELALCKEAHLHALPAKISFEQGAAVSIPYATAYYALFNRAQAKPGETVFIHGASGGVGVAAVQLSRAVGLTVIGTAGTERGLALAKDEGAHHVLNHNDPDYLAQLPALTGGRGVDVILEMAAHKNLGRDLALLSFGGRVSVIGSRGPIEINPRDIMGRNGAIVAMSLLNVPSSELAGVHAALVAGLENGTLRPVVGQSMPLAEAARAHEEVLKPGSYGKIVLIPGK